MADAALNGTLPVDVSESDLGKRVGIGTAVRPSSGWFARLLAFYLRHREATKDARRARAEKAAAQNRTAVERANAAIQKACIQSAVSGGAVGVASTGATFFTASTEGVGGLVAVPVAAVAIASEMALRTWCHIDLICELADVYEVHFDPDDPDDLWRLCALAFDAHDEEASEDDPGKKIVGELTHVEPEEIGEKIGHKLLGESVMRNIIPVVGVAASAITNWKLTRRLGDTTRRYMRYQRAMHDALDDAIARCSTHLPLLVEGMWFVFIADGQLSPEETGCLAAFLKRFDEPTRELVMSRMVEDEYDWLERLASDVLPAYREPFFHALEVAAAVDKNVGLPERRLLRSAARRLEVKFDPQLIEDMMNEFQTRGFLTGDRATPSERPHARRSNGSG
jgi:hypothetical protein